MLSFFELYNLLEAKRKKSTEAPVTDPVSGGEANPAVTGTDPAVTGRVPRLRAKIKAAAQPASVGEPENKLLEKLEDRFRSLLDSTDPTRSAYKNEIQKIINLVKKGIINSDQAAEQSIAMVQRKYGIGVVMQRDSEDRYYIDGKEVSKEEYDQEPDESRKERRTTSIARPAEPRSKSSQVRSTRGQEGSGPSEASRKAWIAARHNLEKEINKVLENKKVLGTNKDGSVKRTDDEKKIESAIRKVLKNQDVQDALNALNNLAGSAGEEQWSLSDEEGIEMLKDMIMPMGQVANPFADGDEDAGQADDPHAGMSWHPYRRDKETGKMGTYVPNDEIEEYYGDQETINSRPKQITKKLSQYQQRKIADGVIGFNMVLRNAAWRELTKQAALSLGLPYKFPDNTSEHSFVFHLNTPDPKDRVNNQIVITLKDYRDLYKEVRKLTGLQSEFEKRYDELKNQRNAGLISDDELKSELRVARETLSNKRQPMKRESNLAMALAYEGQKNPQDLATSVRAMRFSNHLEDSDIAGKTFTVKGLAEILSAKAPSGGLESQSSEEENINATKMIIRVSAIKFRKLGKIDTVGRRGRQGLKMRFSKKNRQIGAPGRDPSKEYTGISDDPGAEKEQLVQTAFNIFKILDGTKMSQLSPSTKIYVNKKNERTSVEAAQDDTGRFAGTGGGEARVHSRYPSMEDDVSPEVEAEKEARRAARRAAKKAARQEARDRRAGGPLGQRGRVSAPKRRSNLDILLGRTDAGKKPPKTEESKNWLDIVNLMDYWKNK